MNHILVQSGVLLDRQQLWMFGGKEVQIPVVSEMDINVLCALWQSVTTYYDVLAKALPAGKEKLIFPLLNTFESVSGVLCPVLCSSLTSLVLVSQNYHNV